MAEQWSTPDAIATARGLLEQALPGWRRPAAYGLGHLVDGDAVFPVVNVGEHFLPAVVLATVCGHSAGTAVYELDAAGLDEAIMMLSPAEACSDYDHPNLAAWRDIRTDLAHNDGQAIAVFVGDLEDPTVDDRDERFRAAVKSAGQDG
ncbi:MULTISPECIES: hypothetical protein [Actinoalloteichus]|uniref:Uncharacterized protein n=1 Tax=Actinoalloteichus fjordicus TaxID=1612552 RepID=A0AAC9LH33_9PSEU|nr:MULTISPECIES: hypothetical protein [Actinoalloteichus]APU16770.1 hypothetical protein UA74_23760 [Actinoalloteichus fjordicus]APU22835.1 hypothetical protein UA75_24265 [Actinoalloteichus sp. GBA129-24]